MEVVVGQQLWAGVDAGKSEHHCVVIDGDGQRLLSQRVANDETVLLELIQAVITLADGGDVTWAIDLNHGGAALLITLLITHEQRLLYIPGRTVITPPAVTAATARPTPRTPRSSPIRPACAAICNRCVRATRSRWICGS
ncbi:hypothetical protein MAGR_64800 [Mycolicibacterium agri]|uniref:Transposase IS110-like N-terminal domain-containing protein n=1 Tax=Mycolicibacterium agri TaxID=36811 RepID=A0A7I9WC72_MYCAG|nr:hypothetical protein MAGR_64800 [Mycolicibacterium agri]